MINGGLLSPKCQTCNEDLWEQLITTDVSYQEKKVRWWGVVYEEGKAFRGLLPVLA